MSPHDLFNFLQPLIGTFGFGVMVLIGLRMTLAHRARVKSSAGREDMERLADAVDQLREQVTINRDEMTELHERLDFAERLLARTRQDEALPPPKPQ